MGSEVDRGEEEEESASELLRDRFRLCTISVAEAEGFDAFCFFLSNSWRKTLSCLHSMPGRKSVNMEDVILSGFLNLLWLNFFMDSKNDFYLAETQLQRFHLILLPLLTFFTAHRNDNLAASLRSFCNDLKAKEPQSDRKRKKNTKKENKAAEDVLHIADP
ncbi:UNVERIFIED_CONTAM: protein MHF1 [Sesamum calycinum]|uniref:Protein MHF1 n=1 Tax=Sesamum calycinum TaxID=2727403 RepID=A0AAW2SYD4_9LAMI